MATLPVAVVGAGISGVACARALSARNVPVVVHDRGYVPGGRMASRTLDGRPTDLGASYLTRRDPTFGAQVDDWVARGLAHPWTDRFSVWTPDGWSSTEGGPLRYGTARGMRSLVVDLAAGLDVRTRSEVTDVGPGPTVNGERFAAVALALPDPQAGDLLADELTEEIALTEDRDWTPALALAAGWPERVWPDHDGVFVHDDAVLSWIADDGRRRGDGAPVLVAHTTASFAAPMLDEPQAAKESVLAALCRIMGIEQRPAWSYLHRWSLASPTRTHGLPFHLSESGIGLCGDGWADPSRVEGAWLSGTALGTAIAEGLA